MTVRELIEHLKTLPLDCSFIGQYKDSSGLWFSVPLDRKNIAKVPGNNTLCVLQLLELEKNDA